METPRRRGAAEFPGAAGASRRILGVNFRTGSATQLVDLAETGGLVVLPSAPVLVEMARRPALRKALLAADLAVADSGLMVLLWRVLGRERIERVSGLEYLKELLRRPVMRSPGKTFWVMPSAEAAARNVAWLRGRGIPAGNDDHRVAPLYGDGDLRDDELLAILRERRPAHVILALGGGVQERLGYYLRENLDHGPGIHCIGAAIGFLSGDQVRIPPWADRLFLGWLFRCISAPRRFVPRYVRALRLVALMIRHRDRAPA